MKRRMRFRPALLAALTLIFTLFVVGSVSAGAAGKGKAKKPDGGPTGTPFIFFAADGMRPDLVDKYVKQGAMPTMRQLMNTGLKGQNGLLQGFPPNTGVGWYTLSTGTWPGEHGSTNNTFHRVGEGNFNNSTSFATTGILQADHIGQSAERSGKTVVSMEWVGTRNLTPALQGPVVDFRTFIGGRGIMLNYDLPGQPAGANAFGVQYQKVTLADASGWTNVPASFSPAKQASFTHNNAQIAGERGLGRLHLRLHQRRRHELQPRADRQRRQRQERRHGRGRPHPGRVGRRQADARLRHVRRQDGRLLRQGDRPDRRPLEVPPLLHLGAARERDLQRARRDRLGGLRGEAEPRLPDLHGGGLRPDGGRHRRRGHLRRAGPHVEGRPLGVPQLHPRPGARRPRHQAGPAARGLADDGRVPAPVHGARDADGHRRQPEPVLRRPHERQRA